MVCALATATRSVNSSPLHSHRVQAMPSASFTDAACHCHRETPLCEEDGAWKQSLTSTTSYILFSRTKKNSRVQKEIITGTGCA